MLYGVFRMSTQAVYYQLKDPRIGIDLIVEIQVHVQSDFLRGNDGIRAIAARSLPVPAGLVKKVTASEEKIGRDHRSASPAHA